MDKLRPQPTLLRQAFDSVSDSISAFGEKLWNIATVTIGVILRDAFEWLLRTLNDIIASSFEAAASFQLIEMRLKGLNLQAAIDSGLEYEDAMKRSVKATKEQMDWIMKLAAITPYDAEDIAKTFTMATAFGFNTKNAKELTENILDFTAAMGLGSQEQERIIINLGQMVQRGKITTREMNDLARGSLVPLADVLDRVSEKMGITTQELTKLISKPGGGVDPQLFIDAFNEMITGEERFQAAAVRMAHTFAGASENIRQSLRDVVGYFILLPGFLDPIGKRLGDIMDEVGARWGEITDAAQGIGTALANIINPILDVFLPDSKSLVDSLIGLLTRISDWLTEHKDDIISFFVGEWRPFGEREGGIAGLAQDFWYTLVGVYNWLVLNWPKVEKFFSNVGTIIKDDIVPWIEDHLIRAFDQIKQWVEDNRPKIEEFFTTLGDIVEKVVTGLTGGKEKKGEDAGLSGFLDLLLKVMQWVIDNESGIARFVQNWITFWFYAELLKTALGFVYENLLGVFGQAGSWLLTLLVVKFSQLQEDIASIKSDITTLKTIDIGATFQSWIDKLKASEWFKAGVAIMSNIISGMESLLSILISKVVSMMLTAWNAALSALGIPTVPILGGGGDKANKPVPNPDAGSGNNLQDAIDSGKLGASTSSKTGSLLGAVVPSTSVVSTSNYNLTINTKASTENILQDYAALKSIRT